MIASLTLAALVPPHPFDILDGRFTTFHSLPTFGTGLLHAIILMSAVTFALGLSSSRRLELLPIARRAAFANCALVGSAILLLAYAFVTHDFRIRYVARYSDRSMSLPYLFTSLWGGQDGSLLWWLLLLAVETAVCVAWMRSRWLALQPYVIATLATVMGFFAVIMMWSANPFAESIAGPRADGEGLNPLLQNFYMIIHPPSLYLGFVSCTVPFAFAIAALASGRLEDEWLRAIRPWMILAFVFLSIGNALGMLWAYEELGWGGFWAWDPVENAAFMPWLTATAFLHSTMLQERRRLLKGWNVFLVLHTFFMTILGTFLTRSGLITSVHAFAQSSIGIYFTYLMVLIAGVGATLAAYRLPELSSLDERLAATRRYRRLLQSRLVAAPLGLLAATVVLRTQTDEIWPVALLGVLYVEVVLGHAMGALRRVFSANPWDDSLGIFVVVCLFPPLLPLGLALVATILALRDVEGADGQPVREPPRLDAVLSKEAAFVANNWILLALQGFIGLTTLFPLFSEAVFHEKVTVGPAFYNRWIAPLGLVLLALMGASPLLGWRKTSTTALKKAFVFPVAVLIGTMIVHLALGGRLGFPAVVASEPIYGGWLGRALAGLTSVMPMFSIALAAFNTAVVLQEFLYAARARMGMHKESFFTALTTAVAKNQRRYGGYVVHVGIAVMFVGFTGVAYKTEREMVLKPDQTIEFGNYSFTYKRARRTDTDPAKMEIWTDVEVRSGGKLLTTLSPAQFIYRRQQNRTSEVAIHSRFLEDIYLAPGTVDPTTKVATFHIYLNPLTSWIWVGVLILLLGSAICAWPQSVPERSSVRTWLRAAAQTATLACFGLFLALTPTAALAQGSSSLHAGSVTVRNPQERRLFENLLCMCGSCERLPLSTCACDWASEMRSKLAARLASGDSAQAIIDDYRNTYGTRALNVPPDRGYLRALWLVPVLMVGAGAVLAVSLVRRWRPHPQPQRPKASSDALDARIDEQLDDLDAR